MKMNNGIAFALAAVAAVSLAHADMMNSVIHRGDGIGNLPENSLTAAMLTWERGFMPEFDIRRTSDGVYVAFHDPWYRGKKFEEYTFAEVRKIDIGRPKGEKFAGVYPPTWDEVFLEMKGRPNRRIVMDKASGKLAECAALVKKYGVEGQVYCCGGGSGFVKEWQRLVPGGKTLLWVWTGLWGNQKTVNIRDPKISTLCESTLQKFVEQMEKPDFPKPDIIQFHVRVDTHDGNTVFAPTLPLIAKAVRMAKAMGVEAQVFPWTEGDRVETYKMLSEVNPDSFGTDYPSVLMEYISQVAK